MHMTFNQYRSVFVSVLAAAATIALCLHFFLQLYSQTEQLYMVLDKQRIPTVMYPFLFGMAWSAIMRWDSISGAGRSNRFFWVIDLMLTVGAILFFFGAAGYSWYKFGLSPQSIVLLAFFVAACIDALFNGAHYFPSTPSTRLATGIDALLASGQYSRGFTTVPLRAGFLTIWAYQNEAGEQFREDENGTLVPISVPAGA